VWDGEEEIDLHTEVAERLLAATGP